MKNKFKGYSLSLLSGTSASFFFIPYKLALKTVSPLSFVFMVYVFSALFNGLFIFLQKSLKSFDGIGNMRVNLAAGLIFGASSVFGNFAIGKSLEQVNAGLTVLVFRSDLMLVALLGAILLKERLNIHFVMGFILCISGFIILNIAQVGGMEGVFRFTPLTWAFLGALNFALVQIALKKIIHLINPVLLNMIRLLSGLVLMGLLPPFSLMMGDMATNYIYLAAASAFFGPFASRNLQMYALKHIPVSEHILFTMITPVITLILSWFLWDDIPKTLSLLGGMIIFMGISWPLFFDMIREENTKKA